MKKGLACLSSILLGSNFNTHFSAKDTAPRITNPEFVIQISLNRNESSSALVQWDRSHSRLLVELFGAKGGITTNKLAHAKWIALGAKEFDSYIIDKVCSYIQASPTIQEYWAFQPDRAKEDSEYYHHTLMDMIYSNKVLMNEFKLANNLTDEDKKYLDLWEHLSVYFRRDPTVIQTAAHLEAIPLHPANKVLLDKLSTNPYFRMLDSSHVNRLLESSRTTPAQVTKAIEILLFVINA